VLPDFPAGDFAVQLLVSELAGDQRVAAVLIQANDSRPESWVEAGSFGVDSGNRDKRHKMPAMMRGSEGIELALTHRMIAKLKHSVEEDEPAVPEPAEKEDNPPESDQLEVSSLRRYLSSETD